jgi:cobalt transporter subunit CbtB
MEQVVQQQTRVRRGVLSLALQLTAAFILGGVVVYGAGFSHKAEAHNAAHDSRHTHAFPCH